MKVIFLVFFNYYKQRVGKRFGLTANKANCQERVAKNERIKNFIYYIFLYIIYIYISQYKANLYINRAGSEKPNRNNQIEITKENGLKGLKCCRLFVIKFCL